jgi:L-iditol 2-dehydrogenase
MKVAAITGIREGGTVEVPEPKIRDNFVRIKIHVVPMCTEYKGFREGQASQRLGHEAAGEVVEVAQPGRVKVGDRVVVMPLWACGRCWLCRQGDYIHCQSTVDPLEYCGSETGAATYAQYMVKQDWQLLRIPDGMSYEHAAMACCGLGPTFGAMQTMNVGRFDTVLITGMGPVGLGGVINGVYRGAKMIAVETHSYRKALAVKLGASHVIDPRDPQALEKIMGLTEGLGAGKAIDCSGVPAAQRLLIDSSRRLGTVSLVGEGGEVPVYVSTDMIRKGLTVRGSWHWNLVDTPQMMKLIAEVGESLDQQITHTFPLDDVREAWELQLTGNCGKVLLYPWD